MRLLFVYVLGVAYVSIAQAEVRSVCEILTKLPEYSGKVVSVRGRIGYGGRVEAEDCDLKIHVGEFDFPNVIAIEWADSDLVARARLALPFEMDVKSRDRFNNAANATSGRNARMYATVEGLLVTRQPPLQLVLKKNPTVRYGFGHLAQAPALIVVKQVSDFELSRERDDGTRERIPFP